MAFKVKVTHLDHAGEPQQFSRKVEGVYSDPGMVTGKYKGDISFLIPTSRLISVINVDDED